MGRAIDEDAVAALIDHKVNAAQEKVDAWRKEFEALTPRQQRTENDPAGSRLARRIADMEARISAMNAVKLHLHMIETYKDRAPAAALGNGVVGYSG